MKIDPFSGSIVQAATARDDTSDEQLDFPTKRMISVEQSLQKSSRQYDSIYQEASTFLDGTSITMCIENPRDIELV
jgi:hypothetical protein